MNRDERTRNRRVQFFISGGDGVETFEEELSLASIAPLIANLSDFDCTWAVDSENGSHAICIYLPK